MTAVYNPASNRTRWQLIAVIALAFWISSSLLLDLVIMPGLYLSGMMSQSDFAGAGYTIFGCFNRIELLCAAGVLTTSLAALRLWPNRLQQQGWVLPLAVVLMAIALIYTYALTPTMSALSLQLNWLTANSTLSNTMQYMQVSYWALEALKLAGVGLLINFYCTLQWKAEDKG
jgi:hypothetical protein